jgi:23S rRNA (adenine2503-C2)-methyltransferase
MTPSAGGPRRTEFVERGAAGNYNRGMAEDLKDKTLGELEQVVAELRGKEYLAKYIFSFIHQQGVNDVNAITPLSKAFREKLIKSNYFISKIRVSKKLVDSDGTTKYLFELSDGNSVEAVLLNSGKRQTVCISTQVGCAMNCLFCATGRIKFQRNLSTAEIVDQVHAIAGRTGERITNVVYMGMGEPLSNYDALIKAVGILNDPNGKNIGIRHQTISTCGDAAGIRKLAGENIRPRLAVSLNACTDRVRSPLMPINVRYPISELLRAVRFYQSRTKMRVTFEYVLLQDLNDSISDAQMLTRLLKGVMCNINLIEYNPHKGCELTGSDRQTIKRFRAVLTRAGFETSIRFRMGRKIKAACGQLGANQNRLQQQ